MLDEIYSQINNKMSKTIENLQNDFLSIRSLRAHPSLLENIKVNVFKQMMPLKNIASISVQDAMNLLINVWDHNLVSSVDKAIRVSNIGLNPRIEGNKLFIPVPPITTERRQEFVKLAKQKSENARVAIRSIRRQANDGIKKMNKSKKISEDVLETTLKKTQQITDDFIKKIDHNLKEKEKTLIISS
jgi:ribosome recycling factor